MASVATQEPCLSSPIAQPPPSSPHTPSPLPATRSRTREKPPATAPTASPAPTPPAATSDKTISTPPLTTDPPTPPKPPRRAGIRRSSPTPPASWKYDVFLSFRGSETRHNFTDHLYQALKDRKVVPFRDNDCLQRGGVITKDIENAIEGSRSSVIVLSEDYASSYYCLDELAKITECVSKYGHRVFPVFYHVDPDDVPNQTGVYAKAFVQHEQDFKTYKIKKWRSALKRVSARSGYHLQKDRSEAEAIRIIANDVLRAKSETDGGSDELKSNENDSEKQYLFSLPRLASEILTEWIVKIQKTEKPDIASTYKKPLTSGPTTKIIISVGCRDQKIQVFLNLGSDGQEDQVPHCKILNITCLFDGKNVDHVMKTLGSLISGGSISHVDMKLVGDKFIVATSEIESLLQNDFPLRISSLENFFLLGTTEINESTVDVAVSEVIHGGDEAILPQIEGANNNADQKPNSEAKKEIEDAEESTIIVEKTNDCQNEEIESIDDSAEGTSNRKEKGGRMYTIEWRDEGNQIIRLSPEAPKVLRVSFLIVEFVLRPFYKCIS